MHTHARLIVAVLRALVRLDPIALCIPPQRLQGHTRAVGRCGFTIESLKVCRSNFRTVVNCGAPMILAPAADWQRVFLGEMRLEAWMEMVRGDRADGADRGSETSDGHRSKQRSVATAAQGPCL